MKLTERKINALPKSDKRQRFKIDGGEGLFLQIMPSGSKSYFFEKRSPTLKKALRLKVGNTGVISLEDARQVANGFAARVMAGEDIVITERYKLAEMAGEPILGEFIEEFLSDRQDKRKLRANSIAQYRLLLRQKELQPLWTMKVSAITRKLIKKVLVDIGKRAPVQSNKTCGVLKGVFNFAINEEYIENNPCDHIELYQEVMRKTFLENAEIKALWWILNKSPLDSLIKMLLLTGCRSSEMRLAKWDWIKENVLVLPAAAVKTNESRNIPLTAMHYNVMPEKEGKFIFSGRSQKGKKPLTRNAACNRMSKLWIEVQEVLQIEKHCTCHDLRRTFRTKLALLGVSDDISERMVGHSRGAMIQNYNIHAYQEEFKNVAELYCNHIKELIKPQHR